MRGHFTFFPLPVTAEREDIKLASVHLSLWGLIKQGVRPGIKQQVCAASVSSLTSPSNSSRLEGGGRGELGYRELVVPGKDGEGAEAVGPWVCIRRLGGQGTRES